MIAWKGKGEKLKITDQKERQFKMMIIGAIAVLLFAYFYLNKQVEKGAIQVVVWFNLLEIKSMFWVNFFFNFHGFYTDTT